ncbi:MAG: DUF4382 domain-containing protein [Haloarculaceae archaeon]
MVRLTHASLAAVIVILAGCAGAPPGTGSPTTAPDATATQSPAAATDGGQVNFYVSDEPNAIGDFSRLNATVTAVRFHRGGENGTWIEHTVDDVTVDLTELRGENASLVGTYDLPNGTYTGVVIEVDDVEGTLDATGEPADVTLPSQRLKLNEPFAVGAGSEVDFVFDLTVVQAGKSGTYVVKPVAGQSGTDVPIERVGRPGDHASAGLNATFVGRVAPGENATVRVTSAGAPVANATAFVDGEAVGRTDASGRVAVHVDADATDLTVRIVDGDRETDLETAFEASAAASGSGSGSGAGSGSGGGGSSTATATPA